jgi:Ca2+-binding RTX toxin-like protein
MTSAGKTVQSFNIATSTAVSISGDTLTINPSKDLSYETGYKLKIASGAITDTSNNKYTDDLTSYNFTTTDTLTTSAPSYTLPKKGANNLTYSGSSDFTGKGNISANVITGGSGNDVFNGGLGNDTLTGGAGNDTFVFDTKPNASTNIDSITDFISGSDDINFSKKLFTAYRTAGVDLTNDFVSGAGATANDKSDHFLYDTNTGYLYYDADGNGSKTPVQFVTLMGIVSLAASDLHIY